MVKYKYQICLRSWVCIQIKTPHHMPIGTDILIISRENWFTWSNAKSVWISRILSDFCWIFSPEERLQRRMASSKCLSMRSWVTCFDVATIFRNQTYKRWNNLKKIQHAWIQLQSLLFSRQSIYPPISWILRRYLYDCIPRHQQLITRLLRGWT